MQNPHNSYYVYRITDTKLNKHYYGSRKLKSKYRIPQDDLGVNYFSSSRNRFFMESQKERPNDFKYKIILSGMSREKAMRLERNLHLKFDVAKNEMFYNLHIHNSIDFCCTMSTGKKISAAHRKYSGKKISESHKKLFELGVKSHAGENNPRHGDHRSWDDIHGVEKSTKLKAEKSIKSSGKGNANACAWRFTSPSGEAYIVTGNCKQFCKEHDLSMGMLKANLGNPVPRTNYNKNRGNQNVIGWMLEKLHHINHKEKL